jgi:phosphate-selective porin
MRIGESLSSMGLELLTSEAGASFMESALVGSLVLVFCMLLVLAWNKNT